LISGDNDCRDKSDELNCSKSSCNSWQFACDDLKCIFKTWVCDGEIDCKDLSDEIHCSNSTLVPTTPLPQTPTTTSKSTDSCAGDWFRCSSGTCVPLQWRCDAIDDCGDNSDELGCITPNMTTTERVATPAAKDGCGHERYQCKSGLCIWDSWLCDSSIDCDSGEDEENCQYVSRKCTEQEFECVHSSGCVPLMKICDGEDNCGDGSDEWGCHNQQIQPLKPVKCSGFTCKSGECIESYKRCNLRPDCFDQSDEDNCRQFFYTVNNLRVDLKSITSASFAIQWQTPSSLKNFQYMPSYSRANTNSWVNMTWIKDEIFTFDKLEPGVTYNVSVYCKVSNESKVYPPLQFITITTESIGNFELSIDF